MDVLRVAARKRLSEAGVSGRNLSPCRWRRDRRLGWL